MNRFQRLQEQQAQNQYAQVYDKPMEYTQPDMIEQYGSIIKDLTDTEKLIDELRMQILGKFRRADGTIGTSRKVYIDENALEDYFNIIRSVVNQNTHFTNYADQRVERLLQATNYTLNRFLMWQGSKIPLQYRPMLSYGGMSLVCASLNKAGNATILDWTKGSFSEGLNRGPPPDKRGLFSRMFGMRGK